MISTITNGTIIEAGAGNARSRAFLSAGGLHKCRDSDLIRAMMPMITGQYKNATGEELVIRYDVPSGR